jgi:hypothetical protein
VVVAVHLEMLPPLVDDEAADDGLGVAQRAEVAGVPEVVDHPPQGHVEGELLDVPEVVDGERVVHVEADEVDLVEPQVAVDEDLPREGDLAERQARALEERRHVGVGVGLAGGCGFGATSVEASHPDAR